MKQRISRLSSQTFASLNERNFRLFFIGQTISQTGTWVKMTAQTLLALRLSDSGVTLGLLMACQFLPILLFGAWAGLVSDRMPKRKLLYAIQSVAMAQSLVLGVLTLTGDMTINLLYVLAIVSGIALAFENPVRRSFVTELVDKEHMANAISLNVALMTGSRVLGPAIAGLLVQAVDIGWCFLLDATSFLAVFACLAMMQSSSIRSVPRVERGKGQVREGFRYLWGDRDLRLILVLVAIVGTAAFNFPVTIPLLAQRTFDGDEGTFSLMLSLTSAGALVGSLWIARHQSISMRFIGWAATAFGATSMLLAVAPTLGLALVAAMAMGGASIVFMSGANIAIQMRAKPQMRGRALAIYAVVFLGTTPIGGPIIGWVSEHIGVREAVAGGGVVTLIAGLVALLLIRGHDEIASVTEDVAVEAIDAVEASV